MDTRSEVKRPSRGWRSVAKSRLVDAGDAAGFRWLRDCAQPAPGPVSTERMDGPWGSCEPARVYMGRRWGGWGGAGGLCG
jgi:hypothetical protein